MFRVDQNDWIGHLKFVIVVLEELLTQKLQISLNCLVREQTTREGLGFNENYVLVEYCNETILCVDCPYINIYGDPKFLRSVRPHFRIQNLGTRTPIENWATMN